jgi:undecaprenyl-diphosphatase
LLDSLFTADAALRAWFATHHAAWLDVVMLAFSDIGQAGTVWLILGTVAALENRSRAGRLWQLALTIALAYVLVDHVLKPSIARSRPFDALMDIRVVGPRPLTYSFPSGHACSAFAGAWVLTLMWPRVAALLWMLAGCIAFSRVYMGVHYPLDILAGALLGVAVGAFVTGGRRTYLAANVAGADAPAPQVYSRSSPGTS